MMELSVLMPVYNCERFLDDAIRSIRHQTHTQFEFVIVNDGSTDSSAEIIARHANEDERIIVVNGQSQGVTHALNTGLTYCNSAYIARMDGDDIAAPERFARQLKTMRTNPEVGILGTTSILIDERGKKIGHMAYPCDHDQIVMKLLNYGCGLTHPSAMIRGAVMHRLEQYQSKTGASQDFDLYLRASEFSRLKNLDEPLLHYRIHDSSMGSTSSAAQARAKYCSVAKYSRRNPLPSGCLLNFAHQASWMTAEEGKGKEALSYAVQCIKHSPASYLGYRSVARSLYTMVGGSGR